MACGMLAMQSAGIKVDRYVAYEIDKYAVQTSTHNFPMIEHRGNVFQADFTEFRGFDFLIGGSPCTYWSIAQKNNRETEASGMGWELFSQYDRALKEAQPMYFIYENNKSMSNAIRESITSTFGFEPICINSSLVSAQNRQRYYWVGKRNLNGTYSRVKVEQPEDRGILLRDVLDRIYAVGETPAGKSFCLTSSYQFGVSPHDTLEKCRRSMCAEPVRIPEYGTEDKARPLGSNYSNNCGGFEHRIFCENPSKQQVDLVAVPLNTTPLGKSQTVKAQAQQTNEDNIIRYAGTTYGASGVAEPCRVGTWPNEAKNQDKHDSQQYRIYNTAGKGVTLCGNGGGLGAKTGMYAVEVPMYATPCEWDENGNPTKAISGADGKAYTVYQVKDGQITIKGKQYPIKLTDGFYIIRKLTVSECRRLQTVPDWYEFPVSDSQAYKMLGNGWIVEVIAHLIHATQAGQLAEEQLDLFKLMEGVL